MYTEDINNMEYVIDHEEYGASIGGYYYIQPHICKDITIAAGVRGDKVSEAIKKLRTDILECGFYIKDVIPYIKNVNKEDDISYYAGEFAECLIHAATNGKGIEIAVGYPKILVFNIN